MESTVDGGGRHDGTLVSVTGGTAMLEKNTITGGRRGITVAQDHPLWDRALLIDNVVSSNQREGIHLAGVSSTLATGNLINANGAGLVYNGHGDATLVGNKILDNGGNGILLDREGQQVLVRLNQIWSNQGDGVKVLSSAGLIEDNDIDGNAGYEINTLEHVGNIPRYYNDVEANTKGKKRKRR
jgi:parallel beta-helix repeat protein